jgi:hypothetical protein
MILLWSVSIGTASAETYYVRNGGDDGADGLSHETAWKTLAKVNGFFFHEGDDLYFEVDKHYKSGVTDDPPLKCDPTY